ncbi:MAG TPA: YoaK family protein [Acidimicrobiales bacterium]|nr:YoaK family protein [Acidimicrobiales bacterium]
MLDAVCYLGLGQVFAEIMTGNLVHLVFSIGTLGTHTNNPVVPYVIALGCFAVGVLLGGRLVRLPGPWSERRIGFAVEWVALLAVTQIAPTGARKARWRALPGPPSSQQGLNGYSWMENPG